MADDMGWGDVGYNGHPFVQTPHLDAMSANGLRFDRWYAAAPVCSPTRGSCLTGRHPKRYGIEGANSGHVPRDEITLADALKPLGYSTGHFGKWHLGTLTRSEQDSNRGGPKNAEHYSPSWDNGFEVCFSTEAKVPTYDPMITPTGWGHGKTAGEPFGTYYWTGPGEKVTENLRGDDSRVIMDRAIPFMREAASRERPFFAVIWFHAPHLPVVAGREHRAPYSDLDDEGQHYFGCITALDEQIGRLREELRALGVAENTVLWFCSDNGPEGKTKLPNNGSSGPFSGRKRSLNEGGIRVPGLLEWPARVKPGRTSDVACVTSDYFPTILEIVGAESAGAGPLDGISLMPVIDGAMTERPEPIAFQFKSQLALSDNRFKIYSSDAGKTFALYDLLADPGEQHDVADEHPETFVEMVHTITAWRESVNAG